MRMFVLLTLVTIMMSCSTPSNNPLLSKWETPFELPPFAQIQEKHLWDDENKDPCHRNRRLHRLPPHPPPRGAGLPGRGAG